MRKLSAHVVVERGEAFLVDASRVLIERIHENGEREVPLEVGRRAREDELAPGVRASRRGSASRRVFPMPGSPTSRIAAEVP